MGEDSREPIALDYGRPPAREPDWEWIGVVALFVAFVAVICGAVLLKEMLTR